MICINENFHQRLVNEKKLKRSCRPDTSFVVYRSTRHRGLCLCHMSRASENWRKFRVSQHYHTCMQSMATWEPKQLLKESAFSFSGLNLHTVICIPAGMRYQWSFNHLPDPNETRLFCQEGTWPWRLCNRRPLGNPGSPSKRCRPCQTSPDLFVNLQLPLDASSHSSLWSDHGPFPFITSMRIPQTNHLEAAGFDYTQQRVAVHRWQAV